MISKKIFMKKFFISIIFLFGINTAVIAECYTERCDPYGKYQDPYGKYQDPYSKYQDPYGKYQDPYSEEYIPSCEKTGAC